MVSPFTFGGSTHSNTATSGSSTHLHVAAVAGSSVIAGGTDNFVAGLLTHPQFLVVPALIDRASAHITTSTLLGGW